MLFLIMSTIFATVYMTVKYMRAGILTIRYIDWKDVDKQTQYITSYNKVGLPDGYQIEVLTESRFK